MYHQTSPFHGVYSPRRTHRFLDETTEEEEEVVEEEEEEEEKRGEKG